MTSSYLELKKNLLASKLFHELASLLEFLGENPFKIRAYRRAGRIISESERDLSTLTEKELAQIEGIGTAISKKLREIYETGRLKKLERTRDQIDQSLIPLILSSPSFPSALRKIKKIRPFETLGELEGILEELVSTKVRGIREELLNELLNSVKSFGKVIR